MPPPPHGHGTVRDRSGPFGFPCSSLPPAAPGGPLHWIPAGKGRCPQGPGQGWAGRRRLLGRPCGRGGYSLARVITQYLSVGAHSASDSQFSWPQHTWQCSAWAGGRSAGRQGAGPGRGCADGRSEARCHLACRHLLALPEPPASLPAPLPPSRENGPWALGGVELGTRGGRPWPCVRERSLTWGMGPPAGRGGLGPCHAPSRGAGLGPLPDRGPRAAVAPTTRHTGRAGAAQFTGRTGLPFTAWGRRRPCPGP